MNQSTRIVVVIIALAGIVVLAGMGLVLLRQVAGEQAVAPAGGQLAQATAVPPTAVVAADTATLPPTLDIQSVATLTPIPTSIPTQTPIPSNTPIPTPTPTDTPVPPTRTRAPVIIIPTNTNTPIPPTNTWVPPTNTWVPPTPTSLPPTQTPVPVDTRGLVLNLFNLEGGPSYGVNQQIWFNFNLGATAGEVPYKALGVWPRKDGIDRLDWFQYSYSGENARIRSSGLIHRDNIRLPEAGNYTLRLAICFEPDLNNCKVGNGNWISLSGEIPITIN